MVTRIFHRRWFVGGSRSRPWLVKTKTRPAVNPPVVLVASEIDTDGNLVLVTYETIIMPPAPPLSRGRSSGSTGVLSKGSPKGSRSSAAMARR